MHLLCLCTACLIYVIKFIYFAVWADWKWTLSKITLIDTVEKFNYGNIFLRWGLCSTVQKIIDSGAESCDNMIHALIKICPINKMRTINLYGSFPQFLKFYYKYMAVLGTMVQLLFYLLTTWFTFLGFQALLSYFPIDSMEKYRIF